MTDPRVNLTPSSPLPEKEIDEETLEKQQQEEISFSGKKISHQTSSDQPLNIPSSFMASSLSPSGISLASATVHQITDNPESSNIHQYEEISWQPLAALSEAESNSIEKLGKDIVSSICADFHQVISNSDGNSTLITAFPPEIKDIQAFKGQQHQFVDVNKYSFLLPFRLKASIQKQEAQEVEEGPALKKIKSIPNEEAGQLQLIIEKCTHGDNSIVISRVENIQVNLKLQNQGIATAILTTYHATLAKQGIAFSYLNVGSTYPMTANFYSKTLQYKLTETSKKDIVNCYKIRWNKIWDRFSCEGQLAVIKLYNESNSEIVAHSELILEKVKTYIRDNYALIYAQDGLNYKKHTNTEELVAKKIIEATDKLFIEENAVKAEKISEKEDEFFLTVFFLDSSIIIDANIFIDSDSESESGSSSGSEVDSRDSIDAQMYFVAGSQNKNIKDTGKYFDEWIQEQKNQNLAASVPNTTSY